MSPLGEKFVRLIASLAAYVMSKIGSEPHGSQTILVTKNSLSIRENKAVQNYQYHLMKHTILSKLEENASTTKTLQEEYQKMKDLAR